MTTPCTRGDRICRNVLTPTTEPKNTAAITVNGLIKFKVLQELHVTTCQNLVPHLPISLDIRMGVSGLFRHFGTICV